jgi:hypothetical protein
MAVDGQLLARTVGELRAAVPRDGDLLVGLGRVVAATRVVVGVDGTGRTLVHEDGRPRWVAVSDAAMELLEQVQHDVGEGPVGPPLPRTGWWRSRTYSASGSGAGLLWWSASCGCGGGVECAGAAGWSAGRDPGGGGDPAAGVDPWSGGGVGALAVVTAELVGTGVELAIVRLRWPSCGGRWPTGSDRAGKGVVVATGG